MTTPDPAAPGESQASNPASSTASGGGPASRRGSSASLALAVLGLAVLATVLVFGGQSILHYFRHPEELRQLVADWGPWAPVGIVLLQMVQIIVAPLPGNALSFAAGYALGVWPTIVWLMAGILLGATADFLVVRLLGRRILRRLVTAERLARLDAQVVRRGTFFIFLLLLVPNPVGDWVYYLAGLTAIPLPVFLGLVLAARLPSNLLESWVGATATRFGVREWAALGLVAVAMALVYYTYRERIQALLERLSPPRAAER
jgi:uncharacterized membrane protein YdjX (TVP38/TMEM64 family)